MKKLLFYNGSGYREDLVRAAEFGAKNPTSTFTFETDGGMNDRFGMLIATPPRGDKEIREDLHEAHLERAALTNSIEELDAELAAL